MNANLQNTDEIWLALSIGNSRYHWAMFEANQLQSTWETPYLDLSSSDLSDQNWRFPTGRQSRTLLHQTIGENLPADLPDLPELWLASVVSEQTQRWQTYPRLKTIQLADIPLRQTYPTLGLDRALAVWGAGITWGWPVLVIDCGTALTLTGANAEAELIGGAILPGLGLQGRSLAQATAALPSISFLQPQPLPPRWARETEAAIASGILHVLLSGLRDFIQDWRQQHPNSQIIFTGGDSPVLAEYMQAWLNQTLTKPIWQKDLRVDLNLIFRGILHLRQSAQVPSDH
jgi:type III pantothenate kinase